MDEGVYYTVSEMAAQFGLTRQTLIYYDKIGLFRPASVSGAGYRLYAPTQIPALRLICLLRELGLSLDETSYGVGHSEDFCCIQVGVCDKGTVPLSRCGR